jgi:Acetyltransferase (GNAT) family.
MNIELIKLKIEDCDKIHKMQQIGFAALLEKYQDYDTSPGAESFERIKQRFMYNTIDHYFIRLGDEDIGYIRIRYLEDNAYRLSQMFILPEFQNRGYAQQAIAKAESFYPQAQKWILDTIKQEPKLCHLYEKMGYKRTGTENNIKPGMDLVDYEK